MALRRGRAHLWHAVKIRPQISAHTSLPEGAWGKRNPRRNGDGATRRLIPEEERSETGAVGGVCFITRASHLFGHLQELLEGKNASHAQSYGKTERMLDDDGNPTHSNSDKS